MVREGRRRADDKIEESFFRKESSIPQKEVPGQRHGFGGVSDEGKAVPRKEFEKAKTEYYRIRGWDPETGIPRKSTLARLGLADIAESLPAS
jgi:aldehyde:ferredoxin oxidoreductase